MSSYISTEQHMRFEYFYPLLYCISYQLSFCCITGFMAFIYYFSVVNFPLSHLKFSQQGYACNNILFSLFLSSGLWAALREILLQLVSRGRHFIPLQGSRFLNIKLLQFHRKYKPEDRVTVQQVLYSPMLYPLKLMELLVCFCCTIFSLLHGSIVIVHGGLIKIFFAKISSFIKVFNSEKIGAPIFNI